MRIIFICGSLEAGRDGVGDYTRKLAKELVAQGNQIAIIALNDRHLKQSEINCEGQDTPYQINSLRLSHQLSWKKRIEKTSEFVNLFDPDWVSLQYVPFSFQIKGLPFGLGKVLSQISAGRKIHIMFHELWIGMSIQSSRRDIFLGWIQRQLTISLIRTLRPQMIHTQNLLYQIQLWKIGAKTALLPLFSNIPVLTLNHTDHNQSDAGSKEKINFVFFGGIHPGAPIEQFAKEAANYATKKNIEIGLTIVGRNGKEQNRWTEAWLSQRLDVKTFGEQTPEKVSEILGKSSIGLSTTPAALSGKSGSIAAMHAHGLPVICVSKPWRPRKSKIIESAPGVFEYSVGNLEGYLEHKDSFFPTQISVRTIAQQFITELSTDSIQV